MKKRLISLLTSLVMILGLTLVVPNMSVSANSYSDDYRYWSQGGSDYQGMREVGCLITAQAKVLYESNVIRESYFNPDAWYNWLLSNGYIASSTNLNMRDHNAPVYYANSVGKNLEYLGYWDASDNQLWFNINAGYYTILHVSGTNTGGHHYVLIDNELSKSTGKLYCYDSFSDRGSVSPQLITRYSIHNGGHVYKANNPVHTCSYSSYVSKNPTCTTTGIKTFTCSCGNTYTEEIPATGHNFVNTVVAPTSTQKGYTLHTCSVCSYSYEDSYINPPVLNEDGWYYCDTIPSDIKSDKYTIEYNSSYEKIQQTSPGEEWINSGVVKNEWQNSGGEYTTETPLQTSDSRILVKECFYHWCIPGASMGSEGNYEQTSKFNHYDEIVLPNPSIHIRSQGDDNGHTYYLLSWDDGNKVYCHSGEQCDGSWGYHDYRCQAWYKHYVYQDRVKVELYKFTKQSGWISKAENGADRVACRYRLIEDIKGDVNADGKFNVSDAVLLQKYLLNLKNLTSEQLKLADINSDGRVNIFDLTLLKASLR